VEAFEVPTFSRKGVYWGNVWSPELVQAMKLRGLWRRVVDVASANGNATAVIQGGGGREFVRLSRSLKDGIPGSDGFPLFRAKRMAIREILFEGGLIAEH
jgi:hypothetical protein